MDPREYGHQNTRSLLNLAWDWCYGLVRRMLSPMQTRWMIEGRRRVLWKALGVASILLGLAAEIILVLVTCYLVDLSLSLMELWAELARKHLELTLS